MSHSEKVAIIGFGAIGRAVVSALRPIEETNVSSPQVIAVLLKPHQVISAKQILPEKVSVVTQIDELLKQKPSLVVECAGQQAVRDCAHAVLKSGVDLMVISTGALATPGAFDALAETARTTGARMIIPAGAIAGLDGLGALKLAGLKSVRYTSIKPPVAWVGTPAEQVVNLAELLKRTVVFEGSAREAAINFPKNANVAATIALATLGLDQTRVRLIADPSAASNTGIIESESAIGSLTLTMSGRASANLKTSASTAFSVIHAINRRTASVWL